MPKTSILQRLAGLASLALLSAGCLVNVSHCSDPGPFFDEAMRSAAAVTGRSGPASSLNVLVYEPSDRKLVRVSLPLDWVMRVADVDLDLDLDMDGICDPDSRACREARHTLRRLRTRDLRKLPLGPLVEVNDDGGERVFVYLR